MAWRSLPLKVFYRRSACSGMLRVSARLERRSRPRGLVATAAWVHGLAGAADFPASSSVINCMGANIHQPASESWSL